MKKNKKYLIRIEMDFDDGIQVSQLVIDTPDKVLVAKDLIVKHIEDSANGEVKCVDFRAVVLCPYTEDALNGQLCLQMEKTNKKGYNKKNEDS